MDYCLKTNDDQDWLYPVNQKEPEKHVRQQVVWRKVSCVEFRDVHVKEVIMN